MLKKVNPMQNLNFKLISEESSEQKKFKEAMMLQQLLWPKSDELQQVTSEATQKGPIDIQFYSENDVHGPIRRGCWTPELRQIKIQLMSNPLETMTTLLWELCNAANPGLQIDTLPKLEAFSSGKDYALSVEKQEWVTFTRTNTILYNFLIHNEELSCMLLAKANDDSYESVVKEYEAEKGKSFEQYLKDDPKHVQLYVDQWNQWRQRKMQIQELEKQLGELQKKLDIESKQAMVTPICAVGFDAYMPGDMDGYMPVNLVKSVQQVVLKSNLRNCKLL